MDNNDKEELVQEYLQRLRSLRYWILNYLLGYGRFSIQNNQIVKKSLGSVIYGTCVIFISQVMCFHLIYESAILTKKMLYTELIILLEVSVMVTFLLLNITFSNKAGTANLINHSIDIDILLGSTETKFLRVLVDKTYIVTSSLILFVQIIAVIFLYLTFDVSVAAHITGSSYVTWLTSAFYDLNHLMSHSSFLSLRTKYLNLALIKFLNVKLQYMPEVFSLSESFWKTTRNNLVSFHKKADTEKFVDAYKMILDHMYIFQDCYRFVILIGTICTTMGTLLSVQAFIIYGGMGVDMLRKIIVVGWVVFFWILLLFMCSEIYVFSRQIDQTKLICTFAQLRSVTDDKVYRFTKAILKVMEMREARISVYGIFSFDPNVLLHLVASVFVYVTAQLQLTMPAVGNEVLINATCTTAPLEATVMKVTP